MNDVDLNILYEDNHLIVVEKPVNVPVQLDDSRDDDLLSLTKAYIKEKYDKPGNVYLALIHRLDRPVGGAIVFAKTSKAASRMANLLRKRELERTYYAIVHGRPEEAFGKLTHYLWKDRQKNEVYAVGKNHQDAKKAVLNYEVLASKQGFSLLEVELETGRSHQIRVQLQTIGHPLYGDQKYGSQVNKVGQQIALWSRELRFIHPVKKEEVTVQSQPPHEYPWDLFL